MALWSIRRLGVLSILGGGGWLEEPVVHMHMSTWSWSTPAPSTWLRQQHWSTLRDKVIFSEVLFTVPFGELQEHICVHRQILLFGHASPDPSQTAPSGLSDQDLSVPMTSNVAFWIFLIMRHAWGMREKACMWALGNCTEQGAEIAYSCMLSLHAQWIMCGKVNCKGL